MTNTYSTTTTNFANIRESRFGTATANPLSISFSRSRDAAIAAKAIETATADSDIIMYTPEIVFFKILMYWPISQLL